MCPKIQRADDAPAGDADQSAAAGGNASSGQGGIGGRIKEIRLICNLNQRDFAALARVDHSYLSKVERGRAKASLEIIAALLRLPQPVNLRYVLFGRGDPILERHPIRIRDWWELEALLIRAAAEEAKLPAKFEPPHISSETYRRWLAHNIFEQVQRMAAEMDHPNMGYPWEPEVKARALEEVEAALDAAEASDRMPAVRRRVRRSKSP
jgi:transcriptional regulator with XRE-family HTH domain